MAAPIQVDLFIPCYVDHLYPETGFSMVKVLEKLGCKVYYNPKQTCCGQPAYNAGQMAESKIVAEKFLRDYPNDRYIVAPSASCVGMVKNNYGRFFDNTPHEKDFQRIHDNIYEFVDFVVNVLGHHKIEGAKFAHKITYHDSCSALREVGLKNEPRILLNNVEGLQLVEMHDNEVCCGFGGTFSVKFEQISSAMAEQKVENALETGATYIVSTDVSCLMHQSAYIQKRKLPLKTIHIADILAAGY